MEKVNKIILDNGLTFLHSQVNRSPVASLVVWVKAGSSAEEPSEYGIAHMCEHNVFKGTKRRGVGVISEEAEFAGGDINAWTSYDETAFHLTLPIKEIDLGMDILADMLQNATIDPDELEKEKEVILEELRRGLDSPQQKLSNEAFCATYKAHPYGHHIIGTEESIKAQTSETLHNFMAKHYVPQNMIVGIVGQISFEEAQKLVEKYWLNWTPKVICEKHGPSVADKAADTEETLIKIMREKVEECHFAITFHSPVFSDEDTPALDLLDVILGSSSSSRLNTQLRNKLNLVNGISSANFTPISQGIFMIAGSLDVSKTEKTLEETVACIKELMTKEVTKQELDKARFILKSATWRKQETAEGLATDYCNQEAITQNPLYELYYNTLLDEVTPAKIKQVTRKYLQKPLAFIVIAPEEATLPSQERINKIISNLTIKDDKNTIPCTIDENGWYIYNLPSGGKIVAQVDHSAPIVAVSISYNGGQRYEEPGFSGIDSFLSKMLSFSTKKHSYKELAIKFDEMAAGVGASSGRNSINMIGTFLSKNFEEGLPLLLECLYQPAFKRLDIALVRRLLLEKIRTKADRPSVQAHELLLKGLYGEHPLGMPKIGLEKDLKKISAGDLKKRHQKIILENKPFISIVGDFDHEMASQTIIEAINTYCKKPAELPAIPEVKELSETKEFSLPAKKEQVHLCLGFLGPNMTNNKERWAMTLFCSAIGGMSGRLFIELRDKESLCYTVSGQYITGPTSGYLNFYIATAPEKTNRAKEGLKRELTKLVTEGITQKELDKARNSMLGDNLISNQYMESRATNIALDGLYNLPYNNYLLLAEELQKITITDIQETAKKYLQWDRAVWAIVGDAK